MNNYPDNVDSPKGGLQNALTDFFASKTADFYHQGIVQQQERWQKVLNADGAYFETSTVLLFVYHCSRTAKTFLVTL